MKAYPFFSVAVFTAAISIFSCSSGDNPSEGEGNSQNYNYCLLNEDKMCLDGPFTSKDCTSAGGKPSNSCPYGGVEPSSSSVDGGQTGGDLSSSSQGASSSSDGTGGGSSSSNGSGSGDKGNDIRNYRTVLIGTQIWMAENLNYAVEGSKCYGEGGITDDEILSDAEVQANCTEYGRLYNWATAMKLPATCNSNDCERFIQPKHQGICPDGWHIPIEEEWGVLIDHAGGEEIAGKKLKARSGWNDYDEDDNSDGGIIIAGKYLKATSSWNAYDEDGDIRISVNGNGTDDYDFSALPGGRGGSFNYVGYNGYWWSATEGGSSSAYYLDMDYGSSYVGRDSREKYYLFSVRCIQD